MYLDHSTLYLEQGANITFANNTARDVGGAIYVYTGCNIQDEIESLTNGEHVEECWFLLQYDVSQTYPLTSSLHFINNSAQNGGVNIFGTSLKSSCPITPWPDIMFV